VLTARVWWNRWCFVHRRGNRNRGRQGGHRRGCATDAGSWTFDLRSNMVDLRHRAPDRRGLGLFPASRAGASLNPIDALRANEYGTYPPSDTGFVSP